MKKLLVALCMLVLPFLASAQIQNPVKWSFSSKKIAANTYELHMTATIEKTWHLYSVTTPEGGPIATSFKFTKNPLATFEGKIKEVGKLEKYNDENFGVEVRYFADKVDFVQVVKAKTAKPFAVKGSLEFQVCDDHQCLPPQEVPFSINVGK
ncbi:thiol:disulfide interchange protein DsbD [Chitinophaga skermanii]|uniref:Thiol:disulfide interchange protein DsbD n=1 Tax=Chitinophaga skermanii TaxID=331697 RepID=A0A327QR05_9BACT|nr:protein-disulfide reductase DsbD domain-containing protein [Chitinophaga skermanii]RAJ04227.1 thiol:disulfide interchange protein DsbD [Chitinophaga skermanii]